MQCTVMGREIYLHSMLSNSVQMAYELKIIKSSFIDQGWLLQMAPQQEWKDTPL